MNKTEEFIKKAKLKHGDTYDYSKVEYKICNDYVIIICKTHGEFLQTPTKHLCGGCKKCADVLRGYNNRSNTVDFINSSKLKHGDIYDYSKVEYIKSNKNVIIMCKIHGEFLQCPVNHLTGSGCCKCGILSSANSKIKNDFIERARQIHGDIYDYSRVEYKYATEKVVIICKKHGDFLQIPSGHLSGKGCVKCGIEKNADKCRSNSSEFIERSKLEHGDLYDYSMVDYKNSTENVIIICKIHGEFSQLPPNHLKGYGCNKCGEERTANKSRSNTDEFIEKAILKHGDLYDYSKVEYKISNDYVIIICKTHGEFLQTPVKHLCGGCSLCVNKTEGKLYEKIKTVYPHITTQFKEKWCSSKTTGYFLPFDFCIPEYNIIIELDGRQHFQQVRDWSSPEKQFENDKFKEKCANDNHYSTIRILQEDVWNDKYDWCKELCKAIKDINERDEVVNIYLCKNGEYDIFT